MQKVISCKAEEVEKKVQPLLDKGWEIDKMIAERVSTSISRTSSSYGVDKSTEKGLIVFVLKRNNF